ncbi:hypothetical protein JK359_17515 [Streptomyces actinomycinicus]|uniref:Uncharacterized protein n=1 Tax=Streptomyces actinomycinicus TaxID=1695166 RepID=A0A937EKQ8_9ACTN|nr:hypothetical protein [Streptomyces actinomycinicus]MBL1083744.1 hypothetical protein [Streptomyces actinomycinicus]
MIEGAVPGGRVVGGVVAGREVRSVVMGQCMGRAAEEQGRFGQPRVECGRSPVSAGLDAKGAEFGDLGGCQTESSGHLAGVAVEFGSEGRVDGKAGHGVAEGVVGHVSVSVGCVSLVPIPAELRIPLVGGNRHFRPSPTEACWDGYKGMPLPAQGRKQGAPGSCDTGTCPPAFPASPARRPSVRKPVVRFDVGRMPRPT